jgi:DNA-binding transcriptional MerR regulator
LLNLEAGLESAHEDAFGRGAKAPQDRRGGRGKWYARRNHPVLRTEGLLAQAARTESNYRAYGADDVERLRFIRRCRSLDMALSEIRALLLIADRPAQSCDGVNGILDAHIEHVSARIGELKALEKALKLLRGQCAQQQTVAACGIMRGLGESEDSGVPKSRANQSHVHGVHKH